MTMIKNLAVGAAVLLPTLIAAASAALATVGTHLGF